MRMVIARIYELGERAANNLTVLAVPLTDVDRKEPSGCPKKALANSPATSMASLSHLLVTPFRGLRAPEHKKMVSVRWAAAVLLLALSGVLPTHAQPCVAHRPLFPPSPRHARRRAAGG